MNNQYSRPVIAILADMPMGRLLPDEFHHCDHTLTPWLYSLFHDLEQQNQYDIHWITLKKYVSANTTRHLKGQTIHILPDPSLALGLLTGHFFAVRRIRNFLSTLQPGIVHVWGIELPYAKACMTQPCARLLSYQGAMHTYCRESQMGILPNLQAFWERRTTPFYEHITCESPWAAECVHELNPHAKIHLIDYGIEDEFQQSERSLTARPSCLFAGTLNARKGVPFLIEAFKHPSLSHIDLYLAGHGKLRQTLEPGSTSNIHWLGNLSRRQLRQQMEKAWCLVLPTLADTGPTIVKEARYMGLPVITTTNAGSKQYIENGTSGYVIPIKNSEAIIHAVLALTASSEGNIAMGLHSLEQVKKALDIRLTTQQFLSLYKLLLEQKSF